ncbi:MAG: DUF4398 domain-containing protein [Deltaproteobacteria bacterium]|nr:DUF4398 domain-containing protein [Deltaproteobacteria bacterium]
MPSFLRRILLLVLVISVAVGVAGCGPILSTYLILNAQAELDGAKAADADRHAPYEYTSSETYLEKAREEQGYSDFGPSVSYAWRAREMAIKGRGKAEQHKKDAQPPGYVPPSEFDADGDGPNVTIRKNDEDDLQELQIVPPSSDDQ